MFQKKNIIAWRAIVFLSVLSLNASFLAISSILTYAATHETVQIFRPNTSTVGSVRVTNETTNNPNQVCVSLPQQDIPIPVPNATFNNQDEILIENFPDSQCSAQGFPNPSNNFKGQIIKLASCQLDPPINGRRSCRRYTTPSNA